MSHPRKPGTPHKGWKKAAKASRRDNWQPMSAAPKDGTAFLAYGRHTHSPPDAQIGVQPGDHWWGIILWDIWRSPGWVFSKDGAPAWSEPTAWQPLTVPKAAAARTQPVAGDNPCP